MKGHKLTLIDVKESYADKRYNLRAAEPWEPIRRASDVALYINTNDSYIIAHNDAVEIHITLITGIRRKGGRLVIQTGGGREYLLEIITN